MKIIKLAFVFMFLTYFLAVSQNVNYFGKEVICADIQILCNEINRIHPEPFHPISEAKFKNRVELIKDNLPDSLSIIEAWKVMYQITALMQEGHTYFFPPMQHIGEYSKFPYKIRIDRNTYDFFVSGSLVAMDGVPFGKKIISINSISTDSILSIFKQSISAENEAFFLFGSEKYFDLSIYAIFGEPEYFDVLLNSGNEQENRRLKSIKKIDEIPNPNYAFEIINDSVALIDINSLFAFSDFKKFCKSTFSYLNKNKIPNLIIDFRGNLGGDSKLCEELVKYFANEPFSLWEKAYAKINPIENKKSNNHNIGDPLVSIDFTKTEEFLIAPYKEKKRFNGNVFVLVNGGTFSSAGACVWCLNHYKLATSIGSETGGLGVHYGNPIRGILPNTGLVYNISSIKWYQIGADDNSNHGLIPQYRIDYSIEDIRQKLDPEFEFILKLLIGESTINGIKR